MEEERAYVDEASKRVGSRIAFKVLSWVSFIQGVVSLIVAFLTLNLGLMLFVLISAIIAFCSCIAWNAVEGMYEKLERLSSL